MNICAGRLGSCNVWHSLFQFREKTDQDYYSLDDMFVSKAAKKDRSGEEEERERQQAISEHRRLAARMEKCPFCFDNAELPKHLIIAIGVKVSCSHVVILQDHSSLNPTSVLFKIT